MLPNRPPSFMDDAMASRAPDGLWQGIQQFNCGEFYACHDTLEAVWMEAPTAEKPFFQGILQLAVALYHLGNHNWRGATILLGEGSRRLEPFEPSYYSVDISDLLDCASAWLVHLQQSGPDHVASVAAALKDSLQGTATTADSLPAWKIQILEEQL